MNAPRKLLRQRGHEEARLGMVELFFDLVFVFAVTQLHALIVGGVIVGAVGDELLLTHPEHLSSTTVAVVIGGPALYLVGNALFKWVTNDRRAPPRSHMVGLALLLALLPLAWGIMRRRSCSARLRTACGSSPPPGRAPRCAGQGKSKPLDRAYHLSGEVPAIAHVPG